MHPKATPNLLFHMSIIERWKGSIGFKLPWNRGYNCYSQFGEQLIIQNALSRICLPLGYANSFIDIGAYHPIQDSNTCMLYRQGFRGIVVDPNPQKIAKFKRYRPEDVAICKAVVPESWEIDEVLMQASTSYDGRESISSTILGSASRQGNLITYCAKTIKLNAVIKKCIEHFGVPRFLTIDIEGLEGKILQEHDFGDCVIPILCVEHLLAPESESLSLLQYQHSPLVRHLESAGYVLISVCAISLIFVYSKFWRPYA